MTFGAGEAGDSGFTGKAVTLAGGVASIVLVAALATWGTKTVLRDIHGVPVVRAVAGDMRIAPETPGGEIAANEGLSVNAVAGGDAGEIPVDRLALAPAPERLSEGDLTAAPLAGPEPAPEAAPVEPAAPQDANLAVLMEVLANAPAIDASVPGVARSLRPAPRPASLSRPPLAAPAVTASAIVGTPVVSGHAVQLGTFQTADLARADWSRLQRRHAAELGSMSPLVIETSIGGQAFFRLRTAGLDGMDAARRLCGALVAGGSQCIPVRPD